MIKWSNREQQILRQLRIGADINEEYKQQPGLRARFGFMLARANAEVERLKEVLKQMEVDIASSIRRGAIEPSDKEEAGRIYKWEVENEATKDPRRMRVAKQLRHAKLDAEILKHACISIDHRKEMLINLGANIREEHGSFIQLLSKEAANKLGHRKG